MTPTRLAAAAGVASSAILTLAVAMYLALNAWDATRRLAEAPALAGERADGRQAAPGWEGTVRLTP